MIDGERQKLEEYYLRIKRKRESEKREYLEIRMIDGSSVSESWSGREGSESGPSIGPKCGSSGSGSSTGSSPGSAIICESGNVSSLGRDLERSAFEFSFVEYHGIDDGVLVLEFNVGITLGMTSVLVTEDGDTIDGTAALEELLQLLGCGGVVNIAHIDRPSVY